MSGGFVPYHLRINKAIDRQLFIDALLRLSRCYPIRDYVYVGMAGRFAEDFRVIANFVGIRSFVSLEMEESIIPRQKFNYEHPGVEFKHETSGDFIASFDEENGFVLWLDYTKPNELGAQLREYSEALKLAKPGDVIRITLNANVKTLGDKGNETAKEQQEDRLQVLKSRVGSSNMPTIPESEITRDLYPYALVKVIEYITKKTLTPTLGKAAVPIAIFQYKDSEHTMLTCTVLIVEASEQSRIISETRLTDWEFYPKGWKPPKEINVPDLSVKERLFIDGRIDALNPDPAGLYDDLGFQLVDSSSESENIDSLSAYIEYRRFYPFFLKSLI